MKKLSDYKDIEAIELWGDLIAPVSSIIGNAKVKEEFKNGKRTIATVAEVILKECPQEVNTILLRIDNTQYNGFSLISRVISLIMEFSNSQEFGDFFKSAEQASAASASTGSATANTVDGTK